MNIIANRTRRHDYIADKTKNIIHISTDWEYIG